MIKSSEIIHKQIKVKKSVFHKKLSWILRKDQIRGKTELPNIAAIELGVMEEL